MVYSNGNYGHFRDSKVNPEFDHPNTMRGLPRRRTDEDAARVLLPYIESWRLDLSQGNRVQPLFGVGRGGIIAALGAQVLEAADITGHCVSLFNMNAEVLANATVTVADAGGTANDTVTVGGKTYKLVAALAAANDVLIGADGDATAINLAAAINGTPSLAGVGFHASTVTNSEVTAAVDGTTADKVNLTARDHYYGTEGNALTLSKTGSSLTVSGATFANGSDGTSLIANTAIDIDAEGVITWGAGDISTNTAFLIATSAPITVGARIINAPTKGVVRVMGVVLANPALSAEFGQLV